ncbi:MAG: hypothetical protein VB070_06315 [Clostridiaceae bacterium]|nr:hypothetical protein [Clostridiaceae bacterium]
MRRRLFASSIFMVQLYILGLLFIWTAASVPAVWQSIVFFYKEVKEQEDVVFIDALISKDPLASDKGIKKILEICDINKASCSVFDLDQNWSLIIGSPQLAGQIRCNGNDEQSQMPYLLVGSDITFPDNSLVFPEAAIRTSGIGLDLFNLKMDINFKGQMKHGSYYRSRNGIHTLDKRILICMTFQQYFDYGGDMDYYFSALQLHDLPASQIADLTNIMLKEKYVIGFHPLRFQDLRNKELSGVMGSLYFITFVLIYYLLMMSVMSLYIFKLVQKNYREYAIHRMCGASLQNIKSRMLYFIILIITPPTLFLTVFAVLLNLNGNTQSPPAFLIPVIAIFTITLIYIYPAKQLEHHDIAGFTRPD